VDYVRPNAAANVSEGGLFSRLNLYLDWMQLNWNEWVINYDFAHQIQMAKNVRQNSTDYSESLRRWFRRMQERGMAGLTEWQRGAQLLELGLSGGTGVSAGRASFRLDSLLAAG